MTPEPVFETVVVVLTTLAADADADGFARTLVEERLAACVSVLPVMSSTYRWKDGIESAAERQLVIKTTAERVDALRTRFHTLHPSQTPELLVLRAADGGDDYLRWVRDSVQS